MPSVVQNKMRKYEEVVKTSGELMDKALKETLHQKVIPIPRSPSPFS